MLKSSTTKGPTRRLQPWYERIRIAFKSKNLPQNFGNNSWELKGGQRGELRTKNDQTFLQNEPLASGIFVKSSGSQCVSKRPSSLGRRGAQVTKPSQMDFTYSQTHAKVGKDGQNWITDCSSTQTPQMPWDSHCSAVLSLPDPK